LVGQHEPGQQHPLYTQARQTIERARM
jgi:hypothetical protein